jgi:hypothetical protein
VYTAAAGAATQNEVTQKTTDLTIAIATFNTAKAANGFGTAVNGLTISGLGAIYKNGTTNVGVGAASSKEASNPVASGEGTVTNGSLTVQLASLPNDSYYAGFSLDGFIVYISKTPVTFSGRTVSMAYPSDFELLTWSVNLGAMGMTETTTVNAAIQAMAAGMPGNPTTYLAWKPAMRQIVIENVLGDRYANTNFLDVGLYKNEACTQEFSGSDTVESATVIYTKFPLEEFVKAMTGPSGPTGPVTTIIIKNLEGIYGSGSTKVGVAVLIKADGDSFIPLASETEYAIGGYLRVDLQVENGSYYIGFTSDEINLFISKTPVIFNGGSVEITYSSGNFDHVTMEQPGDTPGGEPPKP